MIPANNGNQYAMKPDVQAGEGGLRVTGGAGTNCAVLPPLTWQLLQQAGAKVARNPGRQHAKGEEQRPAGTSRASDRLLRDGRAAGARTRGCRAGKATSERKHGA